ncbi:MAG: DoxX family membrane protein [Actinobacteria bacterium]|nr:DoxX family membrane protein [Actinomycetota bacterium]
MLAILFLQSGIDKIVDFAGNRAWLEGHFAKSPLRGQVVPMLATITLTETLAGLLSLAGVVQLLAGAGSSLALLGAQLSALNVVMLFFGQRIAKDYAGAASLVPYFVLSAGAILLLG